MIKFAIKHIKKRAQFFKYCVGGGTAFIVDFSLLYIFTEFLGLWYLWSASASFIIAVYVNYLIQKFWTFKSSGQRALRQFLVFSAVQIVGLFINNTTIYILVESFGRWYMFSKAAAAAIVLIWNFWASKMFVFNDKFLNQKAQIIIAAEIFPPDIGGPATYTYRIAKYLANQKINFKIICYATVIPKKSREEFGRRVTRISSFLPLAIKYFIYFINLFVLSLSISAKVIYAQGPVASGLPAVLVGKILRKRVVIKIVGDYGWEQARMFHASERSIDDWQHQRVFKAQNSLINLKLKFICQVQKFVARQANAIIVPSHYLKNLVIAWGVREQKIKVIYNAVDFQFYELHSQKEAKEKIKIDGDLILTVGRLIPWKGMDTLISIMPEIKKINPCFKLVIAGSGSEEKNLKLLIKDLKLTSSVIMAGRLSQQEMSKFYQASSLFVLNSSYEGLSHVILEAMYYKLPIIASAVGGNPELIQDDYNGCLVEYNNKQAWLAAIKRLWESNSLRERFCSSPLVKMDVFSFDHMVRDTIKILNF